MAAIKCFKYELYYSIFMLLLLLLPLNQFRAAHRNRISKKGKYQILSIFPPFFAFYCCCHDVHDQYTPPRAFYNFTAASFNWITQQQSWKYITHTHTHTRARPLTTTKKNDRNIVTVLHFSVELWWEASTTSGNAIRVALAFSFAPQLSSPCFC